ncbi:MAG: substrate-binding domain-containing protein [Clostridiales bacterium]|nr:substrate-binding domain-containing protein [Clostridiales bacterium]
MKLKKILCMLLCMSLVLALPGCQSQEPASAQNKEIEGLDKLGDVQVVSREEGSGTRSTFAELAGFSGTDEEKTDRTTKSATIANDAEEVQNLVSQNQSAIGYVSLGTFEENDPIKALKVNGVAASLEEKSYPLSRTFYLAYCGKRNELEQDFLSYVHGAGQSIVAESYMPVAKSSQFLSNQKKGTIRIGGSTSVAPLMEKLAKAYMEINPNADIIVEASDSGDGLTRAMSGELDFGMSSRDLKDYEMELLDYEEIAKDQIVLVVNAGNPLEDISMDNLKKIFTGEYEQWNELNQ